jgi:predicted acyl esterase
MPTFTVETGVRVPMRDGVRLATDVYRPTEGPTPTLLTRTPYNKDVVAGFSDDLDLEGVIGDGVGDHRPDEAAVPAILGAVSLVDLRPDAWIGHGEPDRQPAQPEGWESLL